MDLNLTTKQAIIRIPSVYLTVLPRSIKHKQQSFLLYINQRYNAVCNYACYSIDASTTKHFHNITRERVQLYGYLAAGNLNHYSELTALYL